MGFTWQKSNIPCQREARCMNAGSFKKVNKRAFGFEQMDCAFTM
jgi:hypothetical protein